MCAINDPLGQPRARPAVKVYIDFEKWGRTYVRHVITTGRDSGFVEWINDSFS